MNPITASPITASLFSMKTRVICRRAPPEVATSPPSGPAVPGPCSVTGIATPGMASSAAAAAERGNDPPSCLSCPSGISVSPGIPDPRVGHGIEDVGQQ